MVKLDTKRFPQKLRDYNLGLVFNSNLFLNNKSPIIGNHTVLREDTLVNVRDTIATITRFYFSPRNSNFMIDRFYKLEF